MNRVLLERAISSDLTLRVVHGDLTAEPVDAIVNAANERLAHGGGVAGVIARRGGDVVRQESEAWVRKFGVVGTGSAAITSAGDLPHKYIIHAVGPVWGTGDEDAKLASAIRSAIHIAFEHAIETISFPAISSGIFGFPKDRCARVFLETIESVAGSEPGPLREIRLCNIDSETATLFHEEALRRFP